MSESDESESVVPDEQRKRIEDDLPVSFEMVAYSAEAGLGMDDSIRRVCESSDGPLADAFAAAVEEMKQGRDRAAALAEMASGLGVPDLLPGIERWEHPPVSGPSSVRAAADYVGDRWRERVSQEGASAPLSESQRVLGEQLADAMGDIANSLREAYSFLQSIERAAESTPPPLGDHFGELQRAFAEGVLLDHVLRDFSASVNSPGAAWMATAVTACARAGGNLAEVIETLVSLVRHRLAAQKPAQRCCAR